MTDARMTDEAQGLRPCPERVWFIVNRDNVSIPGEVFVDELACRREWEKMPHRDWYAVHFAVVTGEREAPRPREPSPDEILIHEYLPWLGHTHGCATMRLRWKASDKPDSGISGLWTDEDASTCDCGLAALRRAIDGPAPDKTCDRCGLPGAIDLDTGGAYHSELTDCIGLLRQALGTSGVEREAPKDAGPRAEQEGK